MSRFGLPLFLGLLFCLFLLASCVNKKEDALRGVPLEELMEEILLTNATAPEDEEDTTRYLNLYTDVYARMGIDSTCMDQVLQYMAEHPNELNAIMDRVIARLQRQFDSLEVAAPELEKMQLQEEAIE